MTSPGSSGDSLGEHGDQRGDADDQVAGAALLHLFAVDRAAELEVVGVGELVQGDQPRADRAEPGERLAEAELRRRRRPAAAIRSEMSCPTASPATCASAVGRGPGRARRPMTATSSTSQSVWPPGGSAISPYGPVMQLGNLVNTGGVLVGHPEARTRPRGRGSSARSRTPAAVPGPASRGVRPSMERPGPADAVAAQPVNSAHRSYTACGSVPNRRRCSSRRRGRSRGPPRR